MKFITFKYNNMQQSVNPSYFTIAHADSIKKTLYGDLICIILANVSGVEK